MHYFICNTQVAGSLGMAGSVGKYVIKLSFEIDQDLDHLMKAANNEWNHCPIPRMLT